MDIKRKKEAHVPQDKQFQPKHIFSQSYENTIRHN